MKLIFFRLDRLSFLRGENTDADSPQIMLRLFVVKAILRYNESHEPVILGYQPGKRV